jgi:ATP-dependent Clp protease protease subunit
MVVLKYLVVIAVLMMPTSGYAGVQLSPLPSINWSSAPLNLSDPPEPRLVYLTGEVSDITAAEAIKSIKDFDLKNHDDIELDIMSQGGSVYAGLALIDTMQSVGSDIKTVCIGYCMSMGAFILASGTPGKRTAMPNATVMLHQVSDVSSGKLAELQNSVHESERLQKLLTSMMVKATGLSEAKLGEIMNHDNYMNPGEANRLGVIDIIGIKPELQCNILNK